MFKSIKKTLAFVLALICLLSSAIAEDADKVVATYNGGEVTASEVARDLDSETKMMTANKNYFAQITGGGTYTVTEQDLNDIREYVITAYAKYEILLNKMAELGIEDLTEEEKANLKMNAEYYYLQYVYSFTQQGMSADEAAYYLDMQGMTVDSLYENSYRSAIQTKIKDALPVDEEITDEELLTRYEALCAEYEKTYASAPASVESSANSGTPVYFMPEGMKYVKHIILMPDDEALMAEFESAVSKLLTYESEYATITSPTYEAKFDAIVEKAIKDECLENIDASKKALSDVQAKVLEAVKPEADQILSAIEAGESFDSLIETYSNDPGSQQEPIKSKGYLVWEDSTVWDGAFIEAANKLENVGDVSEPVAGYLGVYIVKYDSEAVSGKIDFESVKDTVANVIVNERRSEAFKTQSEIWYEEANIQLNLEAYN